jgi:hypothetical protein
MSDKKKARDKKSSRSNGYRAPAPPVRQGSKTTDERWQKPGALSSILGPRLPADTAMPRPRASFTRGFVTAGSSPLLLGLGFAFVFVFWLGLIAIGFEGPAAVLTNALAVPPIGTGLDLQIASTIVGTQAGGLGVAAILPFILVRSVAFAALAGLVVEALESGRTTWVGIVRGLRRTHVVLATNILYLAILTVSQLLGPLLGPGFAILLFIAAPIAGIYLLVFPPFVAIREGLSMPDSLRRGWRGARLPGRGNLAMAAFYVIPATAILVVSVSGRWSFALLGVNPTWTAWLYILFVNFLHMAALAAFAFRWMSIEAEAPSAEASARPQRRPRPTGARRR